MASVLAATRRSVIEHMRRNFSSLIIAFLGIIVFGCSLSPLVSTDFQQEENCPRIPNGFVEEDLVGTWVASYGLSDSDALIISEDHTYKQIYKDPSIDLYYESGWQPWWLESRPSGYARLHLQGMRRAGEIESIFNRPGGGVDPTSFTLTDVCEGGFAVMPQEVILVVTGASFDTPRGIILRHMRLLGSDWYWTFTLVEEEQ